MEAVVGLLVMLLGVSHGVETYCDGRQNGTQCYGALGGTVVLQLMNKTSEIHRYHWLKNTTVILDVRRNIIVSNLIENRSFFTPSDGTFRINKLIRTDGGEYTLRTFDSDGIQSEDRFLQLTIQAPVSSVLLVSECLSEGVMNVSCSSEGAESPQYSWTLDDHTLTDSELLSGNTETNSITLKQHVKGKLVCSVRNNVSGDLKEVQISTCDLSQLICGVRAAVVVLALIGITVFFAWKKKKNKMAQDSVVRRQIEDQENSVVMVGMRSSSSDL